ncbi:hypothetical protein [Streptomyces sp. CA-132043]
MGRENAERNGALTEEERASLGGMPIDQWWDFAGKLPGATPPQA